MKFIASVLASALGLFTIVSCNNSNSSSTSAIDTSAAKQDTAKASSNAGSTANFRLGVQMWTFRVFSFADALNKVDSAKIKYI